mmetsp:Transcript_9709/g.23879  ORF Transcript_9709/g.23879 Transcript_9709/m.23879 type:complete len:821 (-) Transcript_9709:107-2569(-)|eukprot:CAMPEP_0114492360 /NCGR_PEP_ID=MMETSP0109-20121206/3510_1 /TAXON_ID=29199 /ORGANISM="Chlorarachnion reptans, Strain CCCM449" /LENGTH=820 /DNA_ID=CAMNT_0001669191 /DNA_START=46 /DNA_END=2508 /DNA_ORIENTATION=+
MPALTIFPEAQHFTMLGLVISIGVYGWILLTAADMIGDGAENLLTAMPQYGALIGALLVPILGAIPDGMMILLSGMGDGPKDEIQRQLNVGVGTLAGSTIMLLTIPFAIAIFVNRRPMRAGRALVMEPKESKNPDEIKKFSKFRKRSPFSRGYYHTEDNRGKLYKLGSSVERGFATSAWIMMGSTLTYLIVQIPAFFASEGVVQTCSLASFVMSILLLAVYCIHSGTKQSAEGEHLERAQIRRLAKEEQRMKAYAHNFDAFARVGKSIEEVFHSLAQGKEGLNEEDVQKAFKSLGLNLGNKSFDSVFCEIDLDKNQIIDLKEFKQFFVTYISEFASSSLSLDDVEEDREHSATHDSSGVPPADVLDILERWKEAEMKTLDGDSSQSYVLYLKNLTKTERRQVHHWCNKLEEKITKSHRNVSIQHFSEPYIDAEDFTKPRRRLRIEMSRLKDGKARYDPKLHRWACASGEIQGFCVRKIQNKRFSNFYKKCLELVGKACSKDADEDIKITLTENDVVVLGKHWKLPVYIDKGEAALRSAYKKTVSSYKKSVMDKELFKILLESMVTTQDNGPPKSTMHKDFDRLHRISRGIRSVSKGASRGKPTVIYPEKSPYSQAANESTQLNADSKKNYDSLEMGNVAAETKEEEEEEGEEDKEEEEEEGVAKPLMWMLWGSILVAIFSDPMVDMIDEFSYRLNINAFYVSFIVTPLVSNASEVFTAAKLASKLTDKTLTVALATLYGAAVMNSTFCMAIFTGLVYFRGLDWNYSAEVLIIVIVMVVVGMLGAMAPQQTFDVTAAGIALILFPFSLIFVYVCQNMLGMS